MCLKFSITKKVKKINYPLSIFSLQVTFILRFSSDQEKEKMGHPRREVKGSRWQRGGSREAHVDRRQDRQKAPGDSWGPGEEGIQ